MDRHIVLFANSKHGATTSKLISSAHPVVLFRAWRLVAWTSCLCHMRSTLSKVDRLCGVWDGPRPVLWPCLVHENLRLWCFYGFVSCWNGVTRHTVASQTCRAVHLKTCNIPCSFPNMFVLGVRELVFGASMRWLVRLRCEKGEDMVVSGSTAVVQYPRCLHRNHELIRKPASCGQLKGRGAMPAMGHVPNSCSSSKLVLRSWMLPSLASPVRRRWRPNAGDRSISLLGFRARRCSFSGTVAEPCAWEARCSLDSLRRTVGSGFHLFNNKSDGTRFLNENVMHFVGLCVLLPMLVEFRPLRTVLLLSLIMAFVSWNCYATVTDVSQMLWLSLGVPITEPRRAVRTGRILACLAGTSSI